MYLVALDFPFLLLEVVIKHEKKCSGNNSGEERFA